MPFYQHALQAVNSCFAFDPYSGNPFAQNVQIVEVITLERWHLIHLINEHGGMDNQ